MTREVHCGFADGVSLAALVDRGGVTDLLAEPSNPVCRVGDVLVGRVEKVDRTSGAVFVDIGSTGPAILPHRRGAPADRPLVVQLIAPPRGGKGAEVTCDIALAGRALVHRPYGTGITVSKGLAKTATTWLEHPPPGGWTVRRAAAGQAARRIKAEAEALRARWRTIATMAETVAAPAMLEAGPGVVERLILDALDLTAIRVGDAIHRRKLLRWLEERVPAFIDLLVGDPIDLAEEAAPLLNPLVPLPLGGSLAIETTRALTAIDVDSGAGVDAFQVNRAAAIEIARQVRLRNIGGIIVVDFISMARRVDRDGLMEAIGQAFADDPAALTLGRRLSLLGLFEFARQRRGLSLAEAYSGR